MADDFKVRGIVQTVNDVGVGSGIAGIERVFAAEDGGPSFTSGTPGNNNVTGDNFSPTGTTILFEEVGFYLLYTQWVIANGQLEASPPGPPNQVSIDFVVFTGSGNKTNDEGTFAGNPPGPMFSFVDTQAQLSISPQEIKTGVTLHEWEITSPNTELNLRFNVLDGSSDADWNVSAKVYRVKLTDPA